MKIPNLRLGFLTEYGRYLTSTAFRVDGRGDRLISSI